MLIVPKNASPPTAITIVFRTPVWGADLTTVTAIALAVVRRDGTTATWTMTILSATHQALVAQYTFGAGDLTTTGQYYLAPSLSVPGGQVPARTVGLFVASPSSVFPRLEEDAWLASTTDLASLAASVSPQWTIVDAAMSPYQASPFAPWLAIDTTDGPISVTLWTPAPTGGDLCVLADFAGELAGDRGLAVLASGDDWVVPTGAPGAYGASFTSTTAGLVLRWKAMGPASKWISW